MGEGKGEVTKNGRSQGGNIFECSLFAYNVSNLLTRPFPFPFPLPDNVVRLRLLSVFLWTAKCVHAKHFEHRPVISLLHQETFRIALY